MTTVHAVCGFLGVGKTTFASALTARVGGVRFSVDELYLRLFADGPTDQLDQSSLDRLFAALDDLWPQVIRAEVDVVLDFGFWSRALRDRVRLRAEALGAFNQLYWVRCSDDVALARCLVRNGSPGAFLISEQGFWDLKTRFEHPGPDESCEIIETGTQMSDVSTRLATPEDAREAVAVLRQSITQLCELDHQNDAETLDRWLRNKTPEHLNSWLADRDTRLIIAELDLAVAGVAALHRSGEIRLCYVRPDLARRGVGKALINAVEAHARDWSIANLTLRSSLTARGFYERLGYSAAGDSSSSFGVLRAYPYSKTLPL